LDVEEGEVKMEKKCDEMERVVQKANELLNGKPRIKLLEAGCGSRSHLKFAAQEERFGLDISKEQLDRNQDIQHKILGDIQTYPLPHDEFDVIVCWDLLEHLPRPQDALRNMFVSLKKGGVLILGFPHLISFKGLVTKMTPLWVHRSFYRYMRYSRQPFKTYLRLAMLPKRVLHLADEYGLVAELCQLAEGDVQKKFRNRVRLAGALFHLIDQCARVLTVGRGSSLYLDSCLLILRKSPEDVRLLRY
jgi:SAM-dependent methyltransferase